MVKEAREFEKEWEHMLDWDGYQETTANLLLHRKMRNASSKIRKDVKSRVTGKIASSEVCLDRENARLTEWMCN